MIDHLFALAPWNQKERAHGEHQAQKICGPLEGCLITFWLAARWQQSRPFVEYEEAGKNKEGSQSGPNGQNEADDGKHNE